MTDGHDDRLKLGGEVTPDPDTSTGGPASAEGSDELDVTGTGDETAEGIDPSAPSTPLPSPSGDLPPPPPPPPSYRLVPAANLRVPAEGATGRPDPRSDGDVESGSATDGMSTLPRLSRSELRSIRMRDRDRSEKVLRILLSGCVVLAVLVGLLVAVDLGSSDPGGLPLPAPNTSLAQRVDPSTVIADPMILDGSTVDYMYASQNGDAPPHIPVRTFTTLGTWGPPIDAMPTQPAWAGPWLWNPDVRYVQGRYVMWFTGAELGVALPRTGAMPRCLGWATSKSPLGPFIPSPKPAVCQFSQFGSIDPRTLVTPGGQEWLYWKSDDNAVLSEGKPTIIWAQRLAANGITLLGKPIDLMSNSRQWEGHIVESPQMVEAGGHYYMFFSGNTSGSTLNGIGLADCAGPAGPCDNSSNGPWLGSNMLSQGLGEESLFTQNGKTWLLYSPTGMAQTLAVALVVFGPNGPYVAQFNHLPSVG
jgi:hypothetical protein